MRQGVAKYRGSLVLGRGELWGPGREWGLDGMGTMGGEGLRGVGQGKRRGPGEGES
jgi:hypothetical protein